jgi:hypothetical protein
MADVVSFVSSDGRIGLGENVREAVEAAGIYIEPETKIIVSKGSIDFSHDSKESRLLAAEPGNTHRVDYGVMFFKDGRWLGIYIIE